MRLWCELQYLNVSKSSDKSEVTGEPVVAYQTVKIIMGKRIMKHSA